jgi:hypothetical protein
MKIRKSNLDGKRRLEPKNITTETQIAVDCSFLGDIPSFTHDNDIQRFFNVSSSGKMVS